MDIYGVGVYITGESGVGKSETELELVKRGHRFVADDVVEIHRLSKAQKWVIGTLTAAVTVLFYFVLKWLNTPNLIVSTVSIATSFLASGLMLYRSSYYALAYAVNDIVLISLWIYAAIDDISYLPMIVCFAIFLINDVYGFFSWKIREQIQRRGKQSNQRSKSL